MNKSRRFFAQGLCLCAFLGTIIACKKEDAEVIFVEVPAKAGDGIAQSALLSSTNWQTTKVTTFVDDKEVDVTATTGAGLVGVAAFRANGTFGIDRNDDEKPEVDGTWFLSADGTKRTLVSKDLPLGMSVVDITELNEKSFSYLVTVGTDQLTVHHEWTDKKVEPKKEEEEPKE